WPKAICHTAELRQTKRSSMAKPYSSISQLLRPISTDLVNTRSLSPTTRFPIRSHFHRGASPASAAAAASRGNEAPQQHSRKKHARAAPRAPRRLITISTSGGRWQGQWSCEYMFTLRELQLADIAEEGHDDADVFVRLTIQKVIYVKPGSEADLDTIIQDTIRLTASAKVMWSI
ncbi:hypothetical protein B296_00024438, partial [Ensete ventricosum]